MTRCSAAGTNHLRRGCGGREVPALLVLAVVLAMVGTPAFAQQATPDAGAMAGLPLPAGDVPDASVTVRVLRERMGNNIEGQLVTLRVGSDSRTAITDAQGRAPDDVAAGILWVAVSFSGTLAMARTFERERYNDTLRALLLAPSDRPAIYAGKLLGLLVLLALVEIVLVPLIGLLFNAPVLAYPGRLAALLALGTLGFAAVGTLFAAMLVRVRSRDTLLPVLLYPITIPVMIAGVRGTAALFQATPDLPMAQFWIGLLVFWDVIFITLALWTFEPVMTE